MANEAVTISDLPTLSTPNSSTVMVVNHTVNGITNTYTLSVTSIPIANTPASSSVTVAKGTLLYDSNYFYIAVANNTLKRVALSAF